MKKILPIILIVIIISLTMIKILFSIAYEDHSHEDFALEGLTSLIASNSIDIEVSNIEVYETEDNLYYFIEYSSLWNDELNYNYIFKGNSWGFAIVEALSEHYATYTTEFEDARANYVKKTIFTQSEIDEMIATIMAEWS